MRSLTPPGISPQPRSILLHLPTVRTSVLPLTTFSYRDSQLEVVRGQRWVNKTNSGALSLVGICRNTVLWLVELCHKRADLSNWNLIILHALCWDLTGSIFVRRTGPGLTGSMTRTRGRSTRGQPVTERGPGWRIWTNHSNYLEKDSPTQNQMENASQKSSLYDWPSSTLNISNIFSGENISNLS